MKVMDQCLFIDAEPGVGICGLILIRAAGAGGLIIAGGAGGLVRETLRVDFEELPDRETLEAICAGAERAASLVDAELDWIVGQPLGEGRLMWTLTETPTGDPNAAVN